MWYVSGNRDEEVIEDPNRYNIERERPRHHLSFGFGIHRCVGNRLAELQLKIIWEEILARFPSVRGGGRTPACLLELRERLRISSGRGADSQRENGLTGFYFQGLLRALQPS